MSGTVFIIAAAEPANSGMQKVLEWANIKEPWELWLLVFGVFAQALFFARWIVQWIASERRGESHMPLMFWWLSLGGATLLLVYFSLRGEIVGILGQVIGWVIYIRNLVLLRKSRGESVS